MNKNDLKKLALMGITGGIILSTQGVEAASTDSGNSVGVGNFLAAKCGGGGAGGGGKCGNLAQRGCNGRAEDESPSAGCGSHGGRLTADRGCGGGQGPRGEAGKCGAPRHSCGSCHAHPTAGCGSCGSLTAEVDHPSAVKTPVKHEVTESELLSNLNEESKALYNQLSPEGKKLALKLASQSCKGQNTCKGLNSCKSAENDCAGKGGCKGKSQCSFKDKNKAVKVAAQKMAEKRASLNRPNRTGRFVTQAEDGKPSTGNTEVVPESEQVNHQNKNGQPQNAVQNNASKAANSVKTPH